MRQCRILIYFFFFHVFSCSCDLFFPMLGTISCTTFGLQVGDEIHGRSYETQYICIHYLCLRHFVLCFHLRQPFSVQHHEQQIPSSFQGNLDVFLQPISASINRVSYWRSFLHFSFTLVTYLHKNRNQSRMFTIAH